MKCPTGVPILLHIACQTVTFSMGIFFCDYTKYLFCVIRIGDGIIHTLSERSIYETR